MDSERWKRVRALLELALSVEPEQRERLLQKAALDDAELAREARELLAHTPRELEPPEPARLAATTGRARLGAELGPYRLERVLGSGGMGTVYFARRRGDGFEQEVALKLLRRGLETADALRRFHTERAVLATLQHEHIARFIDGGTTEDGQPWYAMEFVDGEPLDTWCERHALDVPARTKLFLDVCRAVQHAHHNLVVHRDLKPANLLVTREGRVKLLDFGVAKLLADEREATLTGQGVLTPAYASPEQLRGEAVTTASDVYSLGVILYELLCGERPFAAPALVLASSPAPRASTRTHDPQRARALRGDLDTILAKALQAEPARRYSTVDALGEDLRRHLEGETVSARPDTLGYRARTFARRNRLAVTLAGATLLALSGGLAATYDMYREAHAQSELRARALRGEEAQRLRAKARFEDVRALANELLFGLHDDIEFLSGATLAREHLVRTGLVYLEVLGQEDETALAPELAAGYLRIARIQCDANRPSLARAEDALTSLEKATHWITSARQAAPEDVRLRALAARIDAHRGTVLAEDQRIPEAERVLADVILRLEELIASDPPVEDLRGVLAKALQDYAAIAGLRDDHAEQRRLLEQGLALLASSSGARAEREEWAELALRASLALLYENEGRLGEATTTILDVANGLADLAGRTPGALMLRRGSAVIERQAARVLLKADRASEALAHARRAVDVLRMLSEFDTADEELAGELVEALIVAGQALHQSDQPAEALPLLREARTRIEASAGLAAGVISARSQRAHALCHEGLAEMAIGEQEAGREHSREGIALQQEIAAERIENLGLRQTLGSMRLNYGKLLWFRSRQDPGSREDLLGEALEVLAQAQEDFEHLSAVSPAPIYSRYRTLTLDLLAKVEKEL